MFRLFSWLLRNSSHFNIFFCNIVLTPHFPKKKKGKVLFYQWNKNATSLYLLSSSLNTFTYTGLISTLLSCIQNGRGLRRSRHILYKTAAALLQFRTTPLEATLANALTLQLAFKNCVLTWRLKFSCESIVTPSSFTSLKIGYCITKDRF